MFKKGSLIIESLKYIFNIIYSINPRAPTLLYLFDITLLQAIDWKDIKIEHCFHFLYSDFVISIYPLNL